MEIQQVEKVFFLNIFKGYLLRYQKININNHDRPSFIINVLISYSMVALSLLSLSFGDDSVGSITTSGCHLYNHTLLYHLIRFEWIDKQTNINLLVSQHILANIDIALSEWLHSNGSIINRPISTYFSLSIRWPALIEHLVNLLQSYACLNPLSSALYSVYRVKDY